MEKHNSSGYVCPCGVHCPQGKNYRCVHSSIHTSIRELNRYQINNVLADLTVVVFFLLWAWSVKVSFIYYSHSNDFDTKLLKSQLMTSVLKQLHESDSLRVENEDINVCLQ